MPRPVPKLSRKSLSLLFVALFLVLATIVGLASRGVTVGGVIFGSARSALRGISSGVAGAVDAVVAYGRAVVFARSVHDDNQLLREQNQLLTARVHVLEGERDELLKRQQLVDVQQDLPVPTVLVQVTGRAAAAVSLDVFIDYGSSSGIRAGAGAFVVDINGHTYVFGKVLEAYPGSATVIPLLDSRCVISGINSRTGEDVLVRGTDGSTCNLSFISPLPQFKAGDIVVTSSSSTSFPPNIAVGIVEAVKGDNARLVLRPFAPVWATRWLYVTITP
jgi:cell shape-determining protein MreC